MEQIKYFESQSKATTEVSSYSPNPSIIIQEKEEQIELIIQELKAKNKEISSLQFANEQLTL